MSTFAPGVREHYVEQLDRIVIYKRSCNEPLNENDIDAALARDLLELDGLGTVDLDDLPAAQQFVTRVLKRQHISHVPASPLYPFRG